MDDRVECQPTHESGGAVAQPVRGERVGELVDRKTDQQHDGDDDDRRQEFIGHGVPLEGPAYRTGAGGARSRRRPNEPSGPSEPGGRQSRASRSAFLRSNSSGLMAPRSRRSARLFSVWVTSSRDSACVGGVGGSDVETVSSEGGPLPYDSTRSGGEVTYPEPAMSRSYSSFASSISRLNFTGCTSIRKRLIPVSDAVRISRSPNPNIRPKIDCVRTMSLTFSSDESVTRLLRTPSTSTTRRLVRTYSWFM